MTNTNYNKPIAFISRCLIMVIAISFILIPISYAETRYQKTGVVTDIKNDVITIVDRQGNQWLYEGKGYEIGQTVIMKMNTNRTDNIVNDDIIIQINKYNKDKTI